VLVVEDDALTAMYVADTLRDAGCTVQERLASVAEALAFLELERPDTVLLDCFLSDGGAAPVAFTLACAGIPFALLTGADHADLDAVLRAVPRLAKPFGPDAIERMALQLLGTAEAGRSVEQGEPSRH
jgi:CheY-like chemotaxis protein